MADPTTEPMNPTVIGTVVAGLLGFVIAMRAWINRDRVESSASKTAATYNDSARGIVERLERELGEVRERLDTAERERDECNAKYAKLQQVMLEMANKMLTVQGLQDLGHTVIDRLKDDEWREDAL